uniref:SFRICE_035129 n=1 Tax=Spodoptera frugiperda TaxID=7108 RepID=A0A2H1VW26_SPOFR
MGDFNHHYRWGSDYRLEWLVESRRLLPATQFGFGKGLGTADSVGTLTSSVRLALSRDESLVAVFLDVSAAYDSVLLPLLRQKLICQIIGCILSNRTLKLRTPEDNPVQRTAWRGLPQGSVLSPILYNIYTHDLPSCLNYDCSALQYADDIALMVTGSSITDAAQSMNVSLTSLYQWLLSHGLSLSAPKSSAVFFTRRRRIPDLRLEIDGQGIPIKGSARFLGVTLDSKMSGVDHIDTYPYSELWPGYGGVYIEAHIQCIGQKCNGLLLLPCAPCNKQALKKLDPIQAKCLRVIIGAMKSSPINALQVECAEPPLNLRRQYLADRFISKVLSLSTHPLLPILEQVHSSYDSSAYWNHKSVPPVIVRYRELKNLSTPISQPRLVLGLGISKSSVDAKGEFERALSKYWKGWNVVYTDAFKLSRNGCTDVAAYYQNSRIALLFKCPPEASVYTGECAGILESIKFIKSHNLNSRSSIKSLCQDQLHSRIYSSLIIEIKTLLLACQKDGLNVEALMCRHVS